MLLERRCTLISDIKLLELLYSHPEKGLEVMMENYIGLIYTIVYNHLSNLLSNEDIEECVSDVFLDVFNNKNKLNLEKGSIKGFLSVVAKRKAIDLYRKNKNENNNKINIDDVDVNLLENIDDVANSFSTYERNNILLDTIKSLGEPDSEIIIRKYYLRQSSKDISKVLGLKVNTIDKKVSRCIHKLKNMLGGIL